MCTLTAVRFRFYQPPAGGANSGVKRGSERADEDDGAEKDEKDVFRIRQKQRFTGALAD